MKKIKDDISSNSTLLSLNSHNYIAGSTIEESPSTLLQKLHTNERQLRTLAVVLSLTGGLALSFALGVGIMIYWYCHKYKQKKIFDDQGGRIFNENDDDDDEKSTSATNSSGCSCNIRNCNYYINDSNTIANAAIEEQVEQQIVHMNNISSRSSIMSHHEISNNSSNGSVSHIVEQQLAEITSIANNSMAVTSSHNSINDISLLPLPPLSQIPTPEPSAPSAKELQAEASNNNNGNNHSNSNTMEIEEELCHDCSLPPPAYTED